MKKDYLILWFDDRATSVRAPKAKIEKHLKKFGVRPLIRHFDPSEKGTGILDEEDVRTVLDNPELDMIMMDYNLTSTHGNDMIKELRTKNIFVPVVFYSQQHVDELKRTLTQDNVDGVFVSSRQGLVTKVERILSALLEKEQKVRRIRGLLLNSTSEIEARGEEVAKKAWEQLSDTNKKWVAKKFKKFCKDSAKSTTNQMEKLPDDDVDIAGIWNHRGFDSRKKGYLLEKIFEKLNWSQEKDAMKTLCDGEYALPLFIHRNDFAHQTEHSLRDRCNGSFSKSIREELHRKNKSLADIEEKLGIDANGAV